MGPSKHIDIARECGVLDPDTVVKIGRGGFSEVFTDKHRATAVKVTCQDPEDGVQLLEGSRREFDAFWRIQTFYRGHAPACLSEEDPTWPHGIIRHLDWCRTDEHTWLSMACGWRSLDECTPSRIPHADKCRILLTVLEGLEALHRAGVWHRDIKPSNIIISRGGSVWIADFGAAYVSRTAGSSLSNNITTVPFRAPEMPSGDYTERVDVWGAGLVAHWLFRGEHLFLRGAVTDALLREMHTAYLEEWWLRREEPISDPETEFLDALLSPAKYRPDARGARQILVNLFGREIWPA